MIIAYLILFLIGSIVVFFGLRYFFKNYEEGEDLIDTRFKIVIILGLVSLFIAILGFLGKLS